MGGATAGEHVPPREPGAASLQVLAGAQRARPIGHSQGKRALGTAARPTRQPEHRSALDASENEAATPGPRL